MPESAEPALEQTVEATIVSDPVIVADSDSQVGSPNVTNVSDANSVQPDQLIGKTIADRYLIESYLGGGGMSHVYKARHLHIKDKIVALKLLQSQEFVDPRQVLRLQQEANAAGSLSHPNIIAVQDFGLAGPTQPYLVMDYFDGQSLDQLSKAEGTLSIDRLLGILGQICSALAHAHEMKVVHRDIKPSNIMVGKNEQGHDLVKLVDFGIAKRTEEDVEIAKLTHTGDILGSPLYMSPEQCLGQVVDGRSDTYSLGCVTYELIMGRAAFAGDSIFESIYKHLNEAPAQFSVDLRADSRLVGLEAIVFKMLAKRPAERHQFIVEVASDLKQLDSAVNSITGYLRRGWGLWNARRSARARNAVVIESQLVGASMLAVLVALLLLVLPGLQKQSALEEARNSLVRTVLKANLQAFMTDDSVMANVIDRDESSFSVPQSRARFAHVLKPLRFLCAGQKEQEDLIQTMEDSVIDSAVATERFKVAMISKVRRALFGGEQANGKNAFVTLMSGWLATLSPALKLEERAIVLAIEARRHRVFYEGTFEFCKWIGVLLLLVIPALLAARWRNRKKG